MKFVDQGVLSDSSKSPSTRGCGLKFNQEIYADGSDESPSTRGCGLKSEKGILSVVNHRVTLHARVWIEIVSASPSKAMYGVTLHARVWIEINVFHVKHFGRCCHPPREGVD